MSPLFTAVRRAALLCVPFAATLVAGVTLPTGVSAQDPGGPAPGWLPLPNPNAGSPQYPVYDWIGVDSTLDRIPFPYNGPGRYEIYHSYGGGGSGSGSYPME